MGEFEELEAADLLVQHSDLEGVLDDSIRFLESDGAQRNWRDRRTRYLATKPNLTDLLRQIAERPDAGPSTADLEPLTT